jgi:hypothetical protein
LIVERQWYARGYDESENKSSGRSSRRIVRRFKS